MTQECGFDTSWDSTYASGGQLNRYPADGVVSLSYKLLKGRDRAATRILELGCGAGNNAWFYAREGFDVTAVDGSDHCLEFARQRFAEDGLTGTFQQLNFLDLHTLQGPFDFILDRSALYANHWNDLKRIMPMIAGLLSPDGYFLSFIFTTEHPDKKYMACCEEGATWLQPTEEVFGGARRATLLDEEHLRELYAPFTIVDLYKRTLTPLMRDEPFCGDSEWIVICKGKD